jgi:GxxExxY protein
MLYEEYTKEIIAAFYEVHKQLGCGFLEGVYQEALALEFSLRKIPFQREKKLNISYKGFELDKCYQADFICYDKIIVELKALSALSSEHDAQVLNYLKVTGLKVALLVNFGEQSLKFKRFIY